MNTSGLKSFVSHKNILLIKWGTSFESTPRSLKYSVWRKEIAKNFCSESDKAQPTSLEVVFKILP